MSTDQVDILDRVIIRIGVIASVPLYIVGCLVLGLYFAWVCVEDDWHRLPRRDLGTAE